MEAGIAVSGLGRARPGQPGLTRPRPTRDGLAQGGPLTTPGRLAATRPPAPVVPQLAPGYQPPVPVVPPLAVDSPQDHQGGYQTRLMRSPTAPPTRPAPELAANVARESADAVAPDLTGPELADPGLADPGLALPGVAVPGLAGPDPAVPDPAVPDQAASGPTGPAGAGPEPVIRPASSDPLVTDPLVTDPLVTEPVIAPSETAEPAVATALPLAAPAVPSAGDGARTSVTVVSQAASPEPVLPVERAIADPSARRNDGRTGRVAVVPGGHRPGKPDQLQRDRARALLAIEGHRSAIVLGCTVGAGQTTTALLTGEVLASLRSDPIAVLDLNPGPESLARRALKRPALAQATAPMRSSLIVLGGGAADESGRPADPAVATSEFARAASAHRLVITDPSTVLVPRLIALADQLILVAPASAAAARAIGMTLEWLDAHGEPGLATSAIMVMNGVSRRSLAHVEAAERVCMGRCRAIVRIPWDDQLKADQAKAAQGRTGLLSPGTVSAYTALAGVLVTALAGSDRGQADDGDSTGRGPR
jgi:MinD-like ATPase involved in chromosome partitioning or flagellar assembly